MKKIVIATCTLMITLIGTKLEAQITETWTCLEPETGQEFILHVDTTINPSKVTVAMEHPLIGMLELKAIFDNAIYRTWSWPNGPNSDDIIVSSDSEAYYQQRKAGTPEITKKPISLECERH